MGAWEKSGMARTPMMRIEAAMMRAFLWIFIDLKLSTKLRGEQWIAIVLRI